MFDRYEQFKKDVLQLTKIDLNFYKEKQMRRRIDTIATKNGCTNYEEYTQLLKKDKEKFEQFVNFLTINVSEFYRNPDQWKLMDEVVIPKLIKDHGKNLKIWSAACSTGDEPYSLAMAFSKHVPLSNIRITATDIDKQVIASAQAGLYSAKSVASVPPDLKRKYFTEVGGSYKIADEIKRCVSFREHNLLKDTYPKDFHLILCRNVVIYFTDEAKNMIYNNFYNSLRPHGVLFIGSTEQITNYKEIGFSRMSSFYFEKTT
ncbi:MAG: protein-glutamate O-methyltransferase CheR [Muribaculaceae bacterium]|nr:protein-glutamate O-methyltransferase CheR [Roseburia sp.]MCM1430432.1 protein-glutamate O-methyltransferase CheR [Muribaculaceae bacterium]MCM1492372.1 protein-glutamate O-methyltransferase CheR [Muribaculaceae bacterium]